MIHGGGDFATRGAGDTVPGVGIIVGSRSAGPAVLSAVCGSRRFDRRAGGSVLVRRRTETEDVDGVGGGGDAEQSGTEVEGHAIDCGRVCPSAELVELLAARHRENTDDGAGDAGGGQERAVAIKRHAAQGRSMGLDDILGLKTKAVKDDELARGRRDVL